MTATNCLPDAYSLQPEQADALLLFSPRHKLNCASAYHAAGPCLQLNLELCQLLTA
jgi:hypothetical protein